MITNIKPIYIESHYSMSILHSKINVDRSLTSVIVVIVLLAASTISLVKYVDARADLIEFDSGHGMHIVVTAASIFDIFTKPLEHSIEIDADQIFPNETLKHEIISKPGPLEFSMPTLEYNLLGFNISATDIRVVANAKNISNDSDQNQKTRIDFPVMLAKNVNVNNEATNQNFKDVDLSSVYAIYDPMTDKFNFHVPFDIAARYLLK
jgi:hypothetical protein